MTEEIKPITALCIVTDPNQCPAGFKPITRTSGEENEVADLWKDGWFSSVKRRFLCYSTDHRIHYNSFVVDIVFTDSDMDLGRDYVVKCATEDSKEPVLDKKLKLAYRNYPMAQTNSVIVDVCVFKGAVKQGYTLARTINGYNIGYKSMSKRDLEANRQEFATAIAPASDGPPVEVSQENDTDPVSKFSTTSMRTLNTVLPHSLKSRAAPITRAASDRYANISVQRQVSVSMLRNNISPLDQIRYSLNKKVDTGGNRGHSAGISGTALEAVQYNDIKMFDFSFEKTQLHALLNHS